MAQMLLARRFARSGQFGFWFSDWTAHACQFCGTLVLEARFDGFSYASFSISHEIVHALQLLRRIPPLIVRLTLLHLGLSHLLSKGLCSLAQSLE
jgi:hypothetical protein